MTDGLALNIFTLYSILSIKKVWLYIRLSPSVTLGYFRTLCTQTAPAPQPNRD